MDNYHSAKLKACKEFLDYKPAEIASQNELKCDESWIFVRYLYNDYKISKGSGLVYRLSDGTEAGYSETLSIFDLLCHRGEKSLSGEFATVNSLNDGPVSQGVPMEDNSFAELIDKHTKDFILACEAIGFKAVSIGDVGFELEIYKGLKARLKFYKSDDEFPASITMLFEKNMLKYVNYETVFYIAGDIERLIASKM